MAASLASSISHPLRPIQVCQGVGGRHAVLQGAAAPKGAEPFLLPGDDAVAVLVGDALREPIIEGPFHVCVHAWELFAMASMDCRRACSLEV
jgi:hypothetical protein